MTNEVPIDTIQVGDRVRVDMGDIDSLVASIKEVGLLQPIALRRGSGRGPILVAGARRIEACRKLGWKTIPCRFILDLSDALLCLKAERDENTQRKDFSPSEAVAMGEKLEALEPPLKDKQSKGGKKAGKGRASGVGKLPTPKDRHVRNKVGRAVGMSGKTYEKAKQVKAAAEANPDLFGDLVGMMNKQSIDRAYREMKKRQKADAQQKAAKAVGKKARAAIEEVCDLRHCSYETLLADVTPDVIITDPPYPKEFIACFEGLARAVVKVPLVAVMCGQTYLPEIVAGMAKHLKYRWTIAYLTPGGQAVQQFPAKVNTFWKPVLLFGEAAEWIGDVCSSNVNDNDKDHHDWGQSESGMAQLVERLSKPEQLICDPFLGGGTTAITALRLGRKFVGCDIDKKCVEAARFRVLAATK